MFRKAVMDAGPATRAERRRRNVIASLLDAVTLRLHALAVRLDEVPQEFGDAGPVDTSDPQALRREWARQLRLWMSYNPEGIFALKAGAVVGGATLLGVMVVVAAI